MKKMIRKVFTEHPQRKPDELFLGNIKLSMDENDNFDLVKMETGLKTIRVGSRLYADDGKKELHTFRGICDMFGPFPLFISEEECEEIEERDKDLTLQSLFLRIFERKTEEDVAKEMATEKNKEFVGIIFNVGHEPHYLLKAPDCPGSESLDSIEFLGQLIADRYGEDFKSKITFTPPQNTPSTKFHRLSIMEENIFKMWVSETLKENQ